VDVVIELLALEAVAGLAKKRHDGLAGVTANNHDVLVCWVGVLKLRDEAGRADNIECGYAEEFLGVVDAFALEDFGSDGDGAVDWVRDDEYVGVWTSICGCFGEVADDRGVGVEQICT
jgi:hypothetical protein